MSRDMKYSGVIRLGARPLPFSACSRCDLASQKSIKIPRLLDAYATCLLLLAFFLLTLRQFFHTLHMILVTNHGVVVHFNHDYIFQPNSVDLACCIIIDKGILTFQADVGTNSAHSKC